MNRIKNFWTSLDRDVVVNQQMLVLGIAACALAGMVVGLFLAPPKNMTIGSGNHIIAGTPEDEQETPEEEVGE